MGKLAENLNLGKRVLPPCKIIKCAIISWRYSAAGERLLQSEPDVQSDMYKHLLTSVRITKPTWLPEVKDKLLFFQIIDGSQMTTFVHARILRCITCEANLKYFVVMTFVCRSAILCCTGRNCACICYSSHGSGQCCGFGQVSSCRFYSFWDDSNRCCLSCNK